MTDNATTAATSPSAPAPNLAGVAGWRLPALEFGIAALSGLLLSAAFAPLELSLLAFVALIPLLWLPVPASPGRRAAIGYVFGFAHYLTNLWWLNTIGFCAGFLLALICAFYPMAWYCGASALLRRRPASDTSPADPAAPLPPLSLSRECLLTLLLPALWVALEWVRGWLFTGFSWNQLGICQWQRLALIQVAQFTGVYGVSFLIVSINVALALTWRDMWNALWHRGPQRSSVALYLAAAMLLLVAWQGRQQAKLSEPESYLNVALVQGNIAQCREASQTQLDESLAVYTALTRQACSPDAHPKPALVVWPESAIPTPLRFDAQYAGELAKLIGEIKTPMLIGTIDYRPLPSTKPTSEPPVFNSILLLDETGVVRAHYDKIHRVPFGEYVPFSRWFPWLVKWIGMGRDLTPGREYTIFDLPGKVRGGAMICYEDAFGDLARQFAQRGAEVLLTLTNDAWYAESAGARQHFTHAVFRAVENRRPLLRSGNNSDSCLILPNGQVRKLLVDPVTGSRFVRDVTTITVPVWRDLPHTWYSRHGDVFAHLCALVAAGLAAYLFRSWFQVKRARLQKITGDAPAVPAG